MPEREITAIELWEYGQKVLRAVEAINKSLGDESRGEQLDSAIVELDKLLSRIPPIPDRFKRPPQTENESNPDDIPF